MRIAVPLLRFVGVVSIIDAINVVLMSTLDGAGDMKFVSKITLIYVWVIFLSLSYTVGIHLGAGLWGAWYSWLFGFLFLTFMLVFRIYQGKWKSIAV